MKKYFYKKIVVLVILAGIILPQTTHAIFGVGDTVMDPITNVNQIMNMLKEYGLDTLASSLTQIISTKISNKVFNKANGGASGDSDQPSFIENFV